MGAVGGHARRDDMVERVRVGIGQVVLLRLSPANAGSVGMWG